MRFRKLMLLAVVVLWSSAAYAQQAMQPLTFWSEYAVKPGKEEEFLNLVKTVGQPVRDKLMADGVILAWGVEVPVLRGHDTVNHAIWYAVADWASIEKVQNAMAAQIAKLNDEAKSSQGAAKKGQKPAATVAERAAEVYDVDKTKDFVTRDIVFAVGSGPMAAGMLPYTRFNFTKVRSGMGSEYRATWEKYNKPVLDKLLADGTIQAYGLAVEEVKTTGDLTHYTWYAVKDMGAFDKIRSAFNADRDHRSKEERDAITAAFLSVIDPDASRAEIDRALIFHVSGPK
jgi:hypothetical protein